MTADKLFDLIGCTPENYLEDLELCETATSVQTAHRRKRPLLIAAVIALIIVLAGCTALVVSRLNMGSVTVGNYRTYALPKDVPVRTLAGAVGSPEYEAAQEWIEFQSQYDPDLEILISLDNLDEIDRFGLDAYHCYTQEMADKVYEIAEKYGLKLMGNIHHAEAPSGYYDGDTFMFEFLELYGIGNYISVPEGVNSFQSLQYYYDDGTFRCGGDVQFSVDSIWEHMIYYEYYCAVKGTFNPISCNIDDIQEAGYEEWTHTTPDGTTIALVLSEGASKALILADTEDYFITISFDPTFYSPFHDETYVMSRKAIEAFADLFIFTFPITPPQN